MLETATLTSRKIWWRQPRWWVVAAVIVMATYLALVNIFRHLNLITAQFDLGNMDQVLWHSLHGQWFVLTDPLSGTHQVRTAIHADVLLLIYLPFYALWHSPLVMVVLQAIFVATGAFPLFLFGRRYISERAAALLAIAYLFYPSLHWATTFDVHAVVLAMPLILWAAWAAFAKRWWIYGVSVMLLLLAKEEVGLTVALLGLFLAWKIRPRWIGFATVLIGVGWTALMVGYAIPHARNFPGHFALGYYSDFGGTTGQVVSGILTHPIRIIHDIFTGRGLVYQVVLLGPLGFISLLGLPFLLIGVPELLINVLSSNQHLTTIFFQYTSVLTPVVFLSAVFGWQRVTHWFGSHRRFFRVAAAGVIAAFIINVYWWAPLPGTRFHTDAIRPFLPSPYRASISAIQRQLRPSDKVAATNNVAPQFTQRDYEWSFPNNLDRADAVVALTGADYEVKAKQDIQNAVDALLADPQWILVLHQDRLYYFHRVTS